MATIKALKGIAELNTALAAAIEAAVKAGVDVAEIQATLEKAAELVSNEA
jgi:methionine aminopeptidase